MKNQHYLVATIKPWNIKAFRKIVTNFPGQWHLVSDPKKLTVSLVKKMKPRFIFFPHWSWLVPEEILSLSECVCFHETDLPYGRGGSPIQNLIERGHRKTVISALRMEKELDTGPVYLKKTVSLKGSAQEIFERNAQIVAKMIKTMISQKIIPQAQQGPVTIFKRRTPEQSNLAALANPTPERIYDFIRMLDAKTYPKAFLEVNGLRLEFSEAKKIKDKVKVKVEVNFLSQVE